MQYATASTDPNYVSFTLYYGADNVPDWATKMNTYSVRLRRTRDGVTVEQDFDYFQGVGIETDPNYNQVIGCLAQDWEYGQEFEEFPEFCEEFYGLEVRKAWVVWNAMQENNKKLETLYTAEELREIAQIARED